MVARLRSKIAARNLFRRQRGAADVRRRARRGRVFKFDSVHSCSQFDDKRAQILDYREQNFSAYLTQLIGRDWAVGARYRVSEAKMETQLPGFAGISGASSLDQNQRAVLQHGQLFLIYNHPCGFFAGRSSDWYHQQNQGDLSGQPGADFWRHNFFAGYVFPHRRAEIRLGLLNLADQNYRLNPLNLQSELARRRTFTAALRLNY